jgi:hypothetical protein
MPGHSPERAEDTVGVAQCPDCGFIGIISRTAEHDWGEFTYRCEECQLALERAKRKAPLRGWGLMQRGPGHGAGVARGNAKWTRTRRLAHDAVDRFGLSHSIGGTTEALDYYRRDVHARNRPYLWVPPKKPPAPSVRHRLKRGRRARLMK